MKKEKVYAVKYNTNCLEMCEVFDHIYTKAVKSYAMESNMVAVSGESIDRYVKYIPNVIGLKGKAVIMENNAARFTRLKTKLSNLLAPMEKFKKRIKLVEGNIITYVGNEFVKNYIKTPARFVDLGIGCGVTGLTEIGRLMLFFQQKVNKFKKKKVMILDMARRGVSDYDCIIKINKFLEPLGTKIVKVNDSIIVPNKKKLLNFGTYLNSKSKAMKHIIELDDKCDNRNVELTLFTYMNGSAMLTVLLKYK